MNPNETIQSPETFEGPVREGVEKAKGFAQDTLAEASEEAAETVARGEECVRENVASAIAAAFVGGLLIGFALGRREQPTLRQRYVEEPLSQVREVAFAVLAPVAQALREQYGNARSVAHDAADRIHDLDPEPLLKHANRWGRKLKFW